MKIVEFLRTANSTVILVLLVAGLIVGGIFYFNVRKISGLQRIISGERTENQILQDAVKNAEENEKNLIKRNKTLQVQISKTRREKKKLSKKQVNLRIDISNIATPKSWMERAAKYSTVNGPE